MITDWTLYKEETEKLAMEPKNLQNLATNNLHTKMSTINDIMTEAKTKSSKIITKKKNRTAEINLSALERLINKKQNKKSIKHMSDKTKIANRRSLKYYLSKARKDKFKEYCEKIEKISEASRANKILTKDHTPDLGTLKKKDGTSTKTTEETLTRLAEGLLGPQRVPSNKKLTNEEEKEINQETLDKITSTHRINKAINQLKRKKHLALIPSQTK